MKKHFFKSLLNFSNNKNLWNLNPNLLPYHLLQICFGSSNLNVLSLDQENQGLLYSRLSVCVWFHQGRPDCQHFSFCLQAQLQKLNSRQFWQRVLGLTTPIQSFYKGLRLYSRFCCWKYWGYFCPWLRRVREDDMAAWHHWLNGHEFEQTLRNSEGQGSLACGSPWGHKDSDMTYRLNKNNNHLLITWGGCEKWKYRGCHSHSVSCNGSGDQARRETAQKNEKICSSICRDCFYLKQNMESSMFRTIFKNRGNLSGEKLRGNVSSITQKWHNRRKWER